MALPEVAVNADALGSCRGVRAWLRARLLPWVLARPTALPALIGLVTVAVFSTALFNDFVEWDDYANLVDNPDYRGLGWTHLRWMFTTALMGQWIPLAWITLGLDYLVWGMNPVGYHLTNVLLHAANGIVFYFVARRLLALTTSARGARLDLGAAGAALFFAVHPLRAESVAWATERRDVLSGLFFLLTVLLYLKAATGPERRHRWLALSVGAYALAVTAKAIVVTLPALLLLLDVYPLRRLPGPPWRWRGSEARRVLAEKIPYAALAAAGIAMAVWAMRVNSYLTPLDRLPIPARIAAIFYSIWFYFWRTVLPVGFSPLHEMPAQINPLEPRFAVSALAVVGVTAVVLGLRRRWPAGLAVWAGYVLLLSPVSGVLHNGHQLVHDRYSYLPALGFALLFGAALAWGLAAGPASGRRPLVARAVTGVVVFTLVGHAVLAGHQTQVWRDTDTLWRYAIEFEPTCAICYNNLGAHLIRRGMPVQAIGQFERALQLRPDLVRTHGNLGLALLNAGRPREAIPHLEKVLASFPGDVVNRSNLGVALIHERRPLDALPHLFEAVRQDPKHVPATTNLGIALLEAGRPREAIGYLARAVELKPDAPQAHLGLIRVHVTAGEYEPARAEHEVVRGLDARLAIQVAPWL
ncbi:MAG: tetratricopeptide repeat protein, partial [Candidatus Rokubacteria bacterium]|nr:tetratricopeptide repeat protein [Candidatus Rokubacteria bacterium]